MALTAAERQRRYRQNRDKDPNRQAEAKEKARKRWHTSVATKQVKLVGNLSEREHRGRKRKWRIAQRIHRVGQRHAPSNTGD